MKPFTNPNGDSLAIPLAEIMGKPSDFIPAGQILPASELGATANIPTRLRNLPVLTIQTPLENWDLSERGDSKHTSIGTGEIGIGNNSLLTIRFQVGRSQAYWLADPADKRVWKMFSQWRQAGIALVALKGKQGKVQLVINDSIGNIGILTEKKLAHLPEISGKVLAHGAGDLIASGFMSMMAGSDIAQVKQLDYVEVCMLHSQKVDAGFKQLEAERGSDAMRYGCQNLHKLDQGNTGALYHENNRRNDVRPPT